MTKGDPNQLWFTEGDKGRGGGGGGGVHTADIFSLAPLCNQ
jgi:hypothetical protein